MASSPNTKMLLTIPKDLKTQIEELAKEENRSTTNMIITILLKYLAEREKLIPL